LSLTARVVFIVVSDQRQLVDKAAGMWTTQYDADVVDVTVGYECNV
jgi:hypothetical protein